MKSNLIILLLVAALVGLGVYGGVIMFSMSTDQFDQKNIKPFEVGSQTQLPLGSVTTEGFENTTPANRFEWNEKGLNTDPSINRRKAEYPDLKPGLQQYQTYCQVCHGTGFEKNRWGLANSKINEIGMLALDLPSITPHYDDKFLFLKIENGGTAMPRLGHIVIPENRWQIITYLRSVELKRKESLEDN